MQYLAKFFNASTSRHCIRMIWFMLLLGGGYSGAAADDAVARPDALNPDNYEGGYVFDVSMSNVDVLSLIWTRQNLTQSSNTLGSPDLCGCQVELFEGRRPITC